MSAGYDGEQVRRDFDRIARIPPSGLDHNAHYNDELLRHLPDRVGHALDVGCGTGAFARLLARRADHVEAIDLSPAMIETARELSGQHRNVRFEVADVSSHPLACGRYDVIASIATLHHLPLGPTLHRMADALAPGGRLIVLDLLDVSGPFELPRNAWAWCYGRVLAHRHGTGRISPEARRAWSEHGARDHYDSWSRVRRTYRDALPGAQLRRHLLWRYSACWRKPLSPAA
jgi:SAM-dependent methyltransferase